MKLFIPKDMFDNPVPPNVYLCTTNKKIIGLLPTYDISGTFKWNTYSELNFSIDRQYTDVLTGQTVVNPLFDKAEGLRKIYVENIGYFVIQDPDTSYTDKDTKVLSCFSSEYETGTKYLENFRINTGDVDSAEVMYLSNVYGENYTIDTPYKLAVGAFDVYESYYIRDYTDSTSYVYQQVEISDASEYATYDGSTAAKTLYVKKYPNVRFYWDNRRELSLLHLIVAKIPGWTIGHVDVSLWRKERKFDEDRISVYDFLMNEVSDKFKCVVEWDTINNMVNFYEEAEDGITEGNTVQTRWDTDVFISRDNLANEINIKYSTDNIKTKLKVSGADGLDIREVNLGKNYIINLDYYHTPNWMEQDVYEKYDDYKRAVETYAPKYKEATQGWVAAYNKWNDLMNAVPADGNVVLVGDEFKKLYCVYQPIYEVGDNQTTINAAIDTAVKALSDKLQLYHVNEDLDANKVDNILLRLKNAGGDTATIRIYNHGTIDLPEYRIKTIIINATSGLESVLNVNSEPTLRNWVMGDITVDNTGTGGLSVLEGFKITSIGTMGAYFVLAKDETVPDNLQDYGVQLLREKQETYTTIFQTQTEAMYSQEKYQCVASDTPPTGVITEGTKWLDTDSSPVKLYTYTSNQWVEFSGDLSDYENYQRYIDNYEKLQAVQEVLIQKEREAEYCLDGYVVPNRRIDISLYDPDDDFRSPTGQSLDADMMRAAIAHFGEPITRISLDTDLPLYTFTTPFDPNNIFAVYLKGAIPYVAYVESRGVYQAKMNWIANETEFENFFTEDQWIRISPLIREDEFGDDSYLLTGYESEEERMEIGQELMQSADKELKILSQPSLEFSMNMANILALPEFKALISQFQLGNFVRVHIRDGYVKRSRLLEVQLKFDDLSDFSCDFGNLITTKSEIDKHAELLSQAVTAGKQVATSAGDWQKAVDKSNKLEQDIVSGLQNAVLEVGKASGQSIVWDEHGIWGRKLIDGTTDQYHPEQFRIINNKLVFSNDGFKTSKAVFGSYTINGETRWGPLAEYVTADTIEGKFITGGSIEIGTGDTKFIVNEDGSVEIKVGGKDKYASTEVIKEIDNAYRFQIVLSYSGSTVFSDINQTCTITCKVYDYSNEITGQVIANGGTFKWTRASNENDAQWNENHIQTGEGANQITLNVDDVVKNSQFSCSVDFDDTKFNS